jgi:hypothetical protein
MSGILPPLDSLWILYIDDSPNDREIMRMSLERLTPR